MNRRKRRQVRILALAVGLVVVLAVLAVLLSRKPATKTPATTMRETALVTVSGTPLTPLAEGKDPAVGKAAPTAVGVDFKGRPQQIADDGKPKVLVFIAHWCPHCQREVVAFTDYREMHSLPSGVDFISVASFTDKTRANYPPSTWLEGARWPFPVLLDDADYKLARAYGVSATPFWTFIDAQGRVVKRTTGELSPEAVVAMMNQLKVSK